MRVKCENCGRDALWKIDAVHDRRGEVPYDPPYLYCQLCRDQLAKEIETVHMTLVEEKVHQPENLTPLGEWEGKEEPRGKPRDPNTYPT